MVEKSDLLTLNTVEILILHIAEYCCVVSSRRTLRQSIQKRNRQLASLWRPLFMYVTVPLKLL